MLDNKKLKVSDDVFQYITKRNGLMEEIEDLNQKMVTLTVLETSLKAVVAPRDGYIIELKVAEGDTYDGTKVAYVMNKEDCVPVLRAPLDSNSTRTIADGTRAEISSDNYGSELQTLIGKSYPHEYAESEIKRMVKECLMADSRTAAVDSFQFEWIEDGVMFTCRIENVRGESKHIAGKVVL